MPPGTSFNRKNATFTDSLGHTSRMASRTSSPSFCPCSCCSFSFQDSPVFMQSVYYSNNYTTNFFPASAEQSIHVLFFFFQIYPFGRDLTLTPIPCKLQWKHLSNCCFTEFPHRTSFLSFKLCFLALDATSPCLFSNFV